MPTFSTRTCPSLAALSRLNSASLSLKVGPVTASLSKRVLLVV